MFRNNYASYLRQVKENAKVQTKIKFIRTKQNKINLINNFLQDSKEKIPNIADAYKLIDGLITLDSDIAINKDEKNRITIQMIKNVKQMIDQFYRSGNETASINLLEDKLESIIDDLRAKKPLQPEPISAISISRANTRNNSLSPRLRDNSFSPIDTREGSEIHHEIERQTSFLVEGINEVSELLRKTGRMNDPNDVRTLEEMKRKAVYGFNYSEYGQMIEKLKRMHEELTGDLETKQGNRLDDFVEKLQRENDDDDIFETPQRTAQKPKITPAQKTPTPKTTIEEPNDEYTENFEWDDVPPDENYAVKPMSKHQGKIDELRGLVNGSNFKKKKGKSTSAVKKAFLGRLTRAENPKTDGTFYDASVIRDIEADINQAIDPKAVGKGKHASKYIKINF